MEPPPVLSPLREGLLDTTLKYGANSGRRDRSGLPLVLVCPSECSFVCSSFRSPCVRRPSALSPLFYVFPGFRQLGSVD